MLRYTDWDKKQPYLYTGGNDAIIHVYDLSTPNIKEKALLTGWNPFLKKDTDQRGHSGPIMDIFPLKRTTSSLFHAATPSKGFQLWHGTILPILQCEPWHRR